MIRQCPPNIETKLPVARFKYWLTQTAEVRTSPNLSVFRDKSGVVKERELLGRRRTDIRGFPSFYPVYIMRVMFKAPEWLIVVGASFFTLILGVSALWEPDIRWLHFFQSWMYVATVILALRKNTWGYFIGVSAAGLWSYANAFVTTFLSNGLQQLSQWVQTGHLEQPDQLIAVPAWFSNILIVIGCLWAYSRVPTKSFRDAGRFLATFILTTGFFALDMALFQPRYLGIFPQLLHPHLP